MNPYTVPGQVTTDTGPPGDVLDSWKAIAQYLNRDIRTLQRWESGRNLPVHRLPGGDRPSVYALKSELDAWRRGRDIATTEDDRPVRDTGVPTVAVLPFLDLAGDKENEYFADGLADEIITALARIDGLRVIARTSSFAFRGKDQDIRKIGSSLGANAILEGSVRRSGNRIRVTAQLVSAADGCHLWGECFERELTEVFTIQEGVSRAVIQALRLQLGASGPLAKLGTANPEAYQLWLKGRYHTQRQTLNQMLRSRSYFEQAAALDPDFPQAHVGIAQSWWECAVFGLESPREAVAIGRYAVSRALELDPSLGDAVSMLGIYGGVHDFDWAASERHFQRALQLDPGSPDIRRRYAAYLLEPMNRLSEARAQHEAALELDPLSPVVLTYLGHCNLLEQRFDQALERLSEAVEIDPAYSMAQAVLFGVYVFQGQLEKAAALGEAILREFGSNPIALGATGGMYGFLGQSARAEECLHRLETAGEIRYVSPLSIAWVHLGLGDFESGLDWLERALEERDPQIIHFLVKPPLYGPLRDHPRFQALVERMRLK
ncbi:MAG TPA: tetratricopeptide repeat protein [Bryobacteraceae bacterium]|nr:tetratricopeptide repeat protein [Bryobacteraceae bacterium]